MSNLIVGSPYRHLLKMSAPIIILLCIYSMQPLVDLFFIGKLGDFAIAGVGGAATISFFMTALTQIFASGTTSLISRAVGGRNGRVKEDVCRLSFMLALMFGLFMAGMLYAFIDIYLRIISANSEVALYGKAFLQTFIPYLALIFPAASLSAALRGEGIVNVPILIQLTSVVVNILLAPVLISGYLTNHPMGVAGAGLATSLSSLISLIFLTGYAYRKSGFSPFTFSFSADARKHIKDILSIGLPVSAESGLLFIYVAVVYWLIRNSGTETQAGFAIGTRLMQILTMPAIALLLSIPALVGQSIGANNHKRAGEVMMSSLILMSLVMAAMAIITLFLGEHFMRFFTNDRAVVLEGEKYLRIMAFGYLPMGWVFVCSGIFQGMGITWPVFCSALIRLVIFVLLCLFINNITSNFIWWASIGTTFLQAIISFALLRIRFVAFSSPDPAPSIS